MHFFVGAAMLVAAWALAARGFATHAAEARAAAAAGPAGAADE